MNSLLKFFLFCGLVISNSKGVQAADRKTPEPLTVENIQDYIHEVDRIVESSSGPEKKRRIEDYLSSLRIERARQYEGSVRHERSEEKTASIRTKVDFTTQRKNLNFQINPPSEGLRFIRAAPKPEIRMISGSKSRVKLNRSKVDKETGKVSFSLTLVEPNLVEKNVEVAYCGWVDYEYTYSAAFAAAVSDLRIVVDHAAKRLAGLADLGDGISSGNPRHFAESSKDDPEKKNKPRKGSFGSGGMDDYAKGILATVISAVVAAFICWLSRLLFRCIRRSENICRIVSSLKWFGH